MSPVGAGRGGPPRSRTRRDRGGCRFAGEAARLTPSSVEAEVAARRHLDAAEYEVRDGSTAAELAQAFEPLVDSLTPRSSARSCAASTGGFLTDVSGPGIVLCRQAIAEADEDDSLGAEAHGITAEVLMHDGDVPEAVREARAAVEAARRADDAALEIEGLGRDSATTRRTQRRSPPACSSRRSSSSAL